MRRTLGHRAARPGAAALVVAVALALACGGGGPRTGKLEFEADGSFTITEQTRFASGVRGDFERAVRLLEDERYEEGIALLEDVILAAPHATMAHIDLGIAYRLTGEFERASASLTRALELNPRHPVAHNEMGIVMRKMGRFEEARQSYESALAISSDFHFARRNLAILCDVYLGDIPCAIEHYELYVQMVPDDAEAAIWIKDLRNRMEE